MFDAAVYEMLNGIGDLCESSCHKVLSYVANIYL